MPEKVPETPRSASNKRNRGKPAAGDETTGGVPSDNGASGSGAGGTAAGGGNTVTMAQGAAPAKENLTREDKIAAFVANPIMPTPQQVIMAHIIYLLALELGGALQEVAVALLMPAQTLDHATTI
jgi:hypothetical protein